MSKPIVEDDFFVPNTFEGFGSRALMKGDAYNFYKQKSDLNSNGKLDLTKATPTFCLKTNSNRLNPELSYISVPPGSGKTHWAVKTIVKNSYSKKDIILYVAPTKKLLYQTYNDCMEGKYTKVFNSETNIEVICTESEIKYDKTYNKKKFVPMRTITINDKVESHINNANPGDCFLITQVAYFNSLKLENKDKIILLFDEAGDVSIKSDSVIIDSQSEKFFNSKIYLELFPLESDFIMDHRDPEVCINKKDCAPLFRAHMKDRAALKEYIDTPRTNRNDGVLKLLKTIADPKFSVFLLPKSEENRYVFYNFLSPDYCFEGFKKTILISAFFENSELFSILKKNYTLKDLSHKVNPDRVKKLKEGYKNVTIIPLTDLAAHMSKNFIWNSFAIKSDKIDVFSDNYINILKEVMQGKENDLIKRKRSIKELCEALMDKSLMHKFLEEYPKTEKELRRIVESPKELPIIMEPQTWLQQAAYKVLNKLKETKKYRNRRPLIVLNNNIEEGKEHEGFKRIKVKSHGLNEYEKYTSIAFFAALLPTPDMMSFYSIYMDTYEFEKQWVVSNVIQSLTRTAIRKIDNNEKIYIIVLSEKTANSIKSTLYGKPVINLDYKQKDFVFFDIDRLGHKLILRPTNASRRENSRRKAESLNKSIKAIFKEDAFKKIRSKIVALSGLIKRRKIALENLQCSVSKSKPLTALQKREELNLIKEIEDKTEEMANLRLQKNKMYAELRNQQKENMIKA